MVIQCLCVSTGSAAIIYSTTQGGTLSSGYQGATYSPGASSTLRGHLMFKSGITMGDNALTWDADGLVDGLLSIGNAGSLALANDLRLGSTATMSCVGDNLTISGGGNKIILGGNTSLTDGIVLTSNLTIDGQGHTLRMVAFGDAGRFTAGSAQLTLKNMTLVLDCLGVANYFFRIGSYIFENVSIKFPPYSGINVGLFSSISNGTVNMTIRGKVSIESPLSPIILCESNSVNTIATTITIDKNSSLNIGKGTVLALVRNGDANATINGSEISMTDQSSSFKLDGCDFYTSTAGSALTALSVTKGTVLFDNKVRIFNALYNKDTFAPTSSGNNDMTKALIFGDGTASNDVDVRMLSSAYLTVDGCIKYYHS